MPRTLPLTMACWNYDRMRALMDGTVRPEGIDLNYLDIEPPESFFRMLHFNEFDVSEMSMGWYVRTVTQEHRPFRAIPVFPSRGFKHGSIYVHVNSGIQTPSDLIGKRVGMVEFQGTSMIWIKGILADHYSVPVNSVRYFTGGLEQPGRKEVPMDLPGDLSVEAIPDDATLSEMLDSGRLDALYAGHTPSCVLGRSPNVRRLFEDYKSEEQSYLRNTGIFPIGHTVVVREDVLERHPWVARSMLAALEQSKNHMYDSMYEVAVLKYCLPWMTQAAEEARDLFGTTDWWPYGVTENQKTLETFLRYAHEQSLIDSPLTPDQLFVDSTLGVWKK